MTLLTTAPFTAADALAYGNFERNKNALSISQPTLVKSLGDLPTNLTWTFARDGSLSGKSAAGKWFANCSIPLLAGRAVLASLEQSSANSCYLDPAHAGLLMAARELCGPDPAIFAVIRDASVLPVLLACHDFSQQIASHHLWFAVGESWSAQVADIFTNHPGMATPQRFIRTKLSEDDVINPMIADAQRIFGEIATHRNKHLETIRAAQKNQKSKSKTFVLAGERFRLWEDASTILAEQLHAISPKAERFNTDDPLHASPLALAEAVQSAATIVSADFSRANAADLAPLNTRWITWITRPHIPPVQSAGPNDQLILAHPGFKPLALSNGWPISRITIGTWPTVDLPSVSSSLLFSIIADTTPVKIPETVEDLSSHRVLWDGIETELGENPFALGNDIAKYLDSRAGRLDIDSAALDRHRFIESLILPAYQHGLARALIAAKVPLKIHGQGWADIADLSPFAAGPIESREQLQQAISESTALIYAWPKATPHPMESFGKPVIHPTADIAASLRSALSQPHQKQISLPSLQTTLRQLKP